MQVTPESVLPQLRKGVLEYCVLARLQANPAYGLELANSLSDAGVLAGEGTLYPLLSRLRRGGWVETTWQPSASGPPRRYYHLTIEGREALAVFMHTWQGFTRGVNDVLEGVS